MPRLIDRLFPPKQGADAQGRPGASPPGKPADKASAPASASAAGRAGSRPRLLDRLFPPKQGGSPAPRASKAAPAPGTVAEPVTEATAEAAKPEPPSVEAARAAPTTNGAEAKPSAEADADAESEPAAVTEAAPEPAVPAAPEPVAAEAPTEALPAVGGRTLKARERGIMRRRLRALVRQREGDLRDLGGLTLEMHRRDTFKEELLRRKAAEVAAIDTEIRLLQRGLKEERTLEDLRVGSQPSSPAGGGP